MGLPKEIEVSRRENGLTIRYLAQGLFNDLKIPKQQGIRLFLNNCINYHNNPIVLSDKLIYHYFLFHLEDFGSKDKSEIDLIIIQDATLFLVEVKAFTNANDASVKRELVRNYLAIENIKNNKKGYFDNVKEIKLVLLYSVPFYEMKNPTASSYNYFNEKYLTHKGKKHRIGMNKEDWFKSGYALDEKTYSNTLFSKKVPEINQNLYFTTWDNISMICNELGLYSIKNELDNKYDKFKKVKLVKEIFINNKGNR